MKRFAGLLLLPIAFSLSPSIAQAQDYEDFEEEFFPREIQFANEFEAMYYTLFGEMPPFTLPLPTRGPGEIGDGTSTIVIGPGDVGLPIGFMPDNPPPGTPEVVAPSVPGAYPIDFIYFPPNDIYPTGCIKVPGKSPFGWKVRPIKLPDGRIVFDRWNYPIYDEFGLVIVPGNWSRIDGPYSGFPWYEPGEATPADLNLPGNGFPQYQPTPTNPGDL